MNTDVTFLSPSPHPVLRGDCGLGCMWLHPLPSHSAAPHRPLPDAGPAPWLPPHRRRGGSCLTTTQPPSLCLLGEVGWALAPDVAAPQPMDRRPWVGPPPDYPNLDEQVGLSLAHGTSLSIHVPDVYQVLCWTLAFSKQDLPALCSPKDLKCRQVLRFHSGPGIKKTEGVGA